MPTLEDVVQLIGIFEQSSQLYSLDLKLDNLELTLQKTPPSPIEVSQTIPVNSSNSLPTVSQPSASSTENPSIPEGISVNSPLVGVFYTSSSPERPAFVEIGSTVKKGDVIGLIEAMKMFNDIISPCDGVIEQILVANETVVEFGAPLFLIKEVKHV